MISMGAVRTGDPFAGGFAVVGADFGVGGVRDVFAVDDPAVREATVPGELPGAAVDAGSLPPVADSADEAVVAVRVESGVGVAGGPGPPQPATSRPSASPSGPGIRRIRATSFS
ncbi:hypothetical protein AB0F52_38170 [Amycolatopsis sp. NPDC024027]|uniref:hypothetical protein n=1 Tax=Amycolatopsis sp. NPDC024027 TaxID=3154327 RepID=UPI0033CB6486